MATYTQTFNAPNANATGGLQYSNIVISETDIGNVVPFTQTGAALNGFASGLTGNQFAGLNWTTFDMAISGAGSSEVLQIAYDVTDVNAGQMLAGLDALYVVDQFVGTGTHMTAVENAYDTAGNLIGTQTFNYGTSSQPGIHFNTAQQSAHIVITLSESIDMTGTAASGVDLSQISAGISQVSTSQLCSIGDIVFLDSNADGLENGFDSGPGVAGVTVQLLDATGANVLASTVTDANGRYSFNNLFAGTYEVKFVQPTGYSFTTQGVGANTGLNSSANRTTGITGPITLTAGQQNHNVEAGLIASASTGTASLGDYVWLDSNANGLQDSTEHGVAGVTVDLLSSTGTILAVTTTDGTGHYAFNNLAAGTYQVKFVAPTGQTFTQQVASPTGTNSDANTSSGLSGPITLTAGQVNNTIDAGLISSGGISVLKTPCKMVVNQCGQVTYNFKVTNTGTAGITNVNIKDNIGTASNPNVVTPKALLSCGYNVGDANHNNVLDAGETWQYSETINQIACKTGASGSVCHTPAGSNLKEGCTAWVSTTFDAARCNDGDTYVFQGIKCTISGAGVGSSPIIMKCPDAVVKFDRYCTQPTTTYDSDRNCWVTTLPSGSNPGSIFMSGLPITVPKGCDLSKCSVTYSIDDSSNNCGIGTVSWDASCKGFASFSKNGCTGLTDYNQIGVKVCDYDSAYGNGGDCNNGYGWNGNNYCNSNYGYSYGGCGGSGYGYNGTGWIGCGADDAGTPENQYCQYNCDTAGYSTCYGGYGGYGYGGYGCNYGGYGGGCYGYGGYNYNYGCGGYTYQYGCGGGSYSSGGSCNDGGSACGTGTGGVTGILGAADTVTVLGTTTAGTTVSATDTKEVQVISGISNVQVDGCAPTGTLTTLFGGARTLEFSYNPSNTVCLKQVQTGLGTATGSNNDTLAFIEISNNSSAFASGAQIYFKGMVAAGQKIFADATLNPLTNVANSTATDHFDTTAGAKLYAFVFASAADFAAGVNPLQTIAYNTSGSQAMHIGDQIGSLTLVGYVGTKDGYLMS